MSQIITDSLLLIIIFWYHIESLSLYLFQLVATLWLCALLSQLLQFLL